MKSEVEFWSELASKLMRNALCPGSHGDLPAERGAAHANGDRGRATTDRGLPKDHAEDRRIDIQRVARRKLVSARSSLAGLAPEDCIRAMAEHDRRAHVSMGDAPWNRPATTIVIRMDNQPSWEWARLIRKLRWIGLEDEARRLEHAVSTLPPEERGTVSVGPFSTD